MSQQESVHIHTRVCMIEVRLIFEILMSHNFDCFVFKLPNPTMCDLLPFDIDFKFKVKASLNGVFAASFFW